MRPLLLLLAGFAMQASAQSLRLLDVIGNPGIADGETSFAHTLDWDESEILVGAPAALHVYDSESRNHKYRLSRREDLPTGYSYNPSVLTTPGHFLAVASRVNRQEFLQVFRRSDGSLERTISAPSGSNYQPGFGSALARQENRLFVSVLHNTPPGGSSATGAIYEYDLQTWEQDARVFRPGDGEWFDGFGDAMDVENGILAVGANRKDNFKGAAYLFDTESRELIAKIQMPVPAANEWFGTDVRLKDGKLYVTSRSAVWEYEAATGAYVGKFSPVPAAGYYDWFGSGVEIVGDGLLAVWSDAALYQFDTATRQQLAAFPDPFGGDTVSAGPGEMKARGDVLLSGARGGTAPETSGGAILVMTTAPTGAVLTVPDATGSEEQAGVTITLQLDPPASGDVTVNYQTRQESARAGMDFIPRSGSLTIPAGEATATLAIDIIDDNDCEAEERFFLDILGGSGASIPPLEVAIKITDNDAAIAIPTGSGISLNLPDLAGDELGEVVTAWGNVAYVAVDDLDGSGLFRGGVRVVDLHSKDQVAEIRPDGFIDGARLGLGLAVDRDLLAVGVQNSLESPNLPAVYLYDRESLSRRLILLPPDANYIGFGYQIAIGPEHILVGMPYEDQRGYQVGAVLVYDRATGAYLSRIESPTPDLGSQFGASVTFGGDRAVIGAEGRIYSFDLHDNNRLLFEVETGTRDTSHITSDFGEIVQANEDYIVAGNPWDDTFQANSGSVLIFDARTGVHINTIRTRYSSANSRLGRSLSLIGNLLAVSGEVAGIDLVEIPSGHLLTHFEVPRSLVSSGFKQSVTLTESHVVAGLPWGRSNYNGRVIAFPREALELSFSGTLTTDRQSGLLVGKLEETSTLQSPPFRIYVRGLPPGVTLANAAGTGGPDSAPYILYNQPSAMGSTLDLTLEFLVSDRNASFSPEFEVELLPEAEATWKPANAGTAPARITRLPDGSVMLEYDVVPGESYRIEYTPERGPWVPVPGEVSSPTQRMRWIDNGPPKTSSHPSSTPSRMYRLVGPLAPE
ncbi:Calx-beta domain-containing protein [Luteolibacter marinus]|uniref:Calx-beta domain-containing protein n=1 Tax=Luteolibacter marinus TaxID=2776705 RepID=UPI00186934C2|nr:Calx-beta domain-containing protein [Luteolibacter marinus]